MKTLKEFITEAKKSGVDKYPTGLHRDQDTGYEFDDAEAIANAGPAKTPKEGERVLLVPRKKVKEYPHGTPVIGWKNKK